MIVGAVARCSASIATKYGVMLCPEPAEGAAPLSSISFDPAGEHPMDFPLCDGHLRLVQTLERNASEKNGARV